MNLIKPILILALVGAFTFSSCKKEEREGYFVTIDIDAPSTVQSGESFSVAVNYARENDVIHNVLVVVVDEQGQHHHKLIERHVHEANNYTFQQDDVILEQPGTYVLRASSTDMHEGADADGEHAGHDADSGSGEHADNVSEHIITVQ